MACYGPISAWRLDDGEIVFREAGKIAAELKLPCGRCIGCRLDRSRQWAIRCMNEASLHDSSLFVTLTYDDAHIPPGGALRYPDYQGFMKRLRRWHVYEWRNQNPGASKSQYPGVRFYMCGEYGEKTLRPHYHALLFGLYLPDREPIGKSGDNMLWRSPTLERLWPHGHSSFGQVTFESAAYVARYTMKKITGEAAKEHYKRVDPASGEIFDVPPEFSRMSLKPGIGAPWLKKYKNDVYTFDAVNIRGKDMKPPRYYDKKLQEEDPDRFEELQAERFWKSQTDSNLDNNSRERLEVRHNVAKAASKLKKRNLE